MTRNTPMQDSRLLAQVIERMSLESDFEKMCQFATQVTMEVLSAHLSALALPDEQDAALGLRFRFFSGFPPDIDTQSLPGITPGTAAAFKSGQCVFVPDYLNYAGAMPAYVRAGVRSGFAAPIRLGESVIGVLTLAWTQPAEKPGPEETQLVEAVLRQVGFAYQRDQLLRALSVSRAEAIAVHEKLERVLAVSPVVIYTASLDPKRGQSSLNITYLSDNIGQLVGYEKESFIAEPTRWYTLMHPDDLQPVLLQNNPEAIARGTFERQYRVRHQKGHDIWVQDKLHLFADPSRQNVHVVGALLNISERKLAETELLRHRDHLQELVREQTADLIAAKESAENAMRDAKKAEEHARYLALNDALTGLPNRLLLQERLHQAMSHSQREGKKLAVLFIDLDRFKNVNDSLGHSIGDLLLCEVGRRLTSGVRETDTVSRQGGDEFIILLSHIDDINTVSHMADNLLRVVSKPYAIDQHELSVTHSIGISIYPNDGANIEDLLRKADAAMYRAKDLGRNNFQFYAQEVSNETPNRR
jgi:diguanylate cyclase (GGDEF)-like protein/PAS domain S-box-containing protein